MEGVQKRKESRDYAIYFPPPSTSLFIIYISELFILKLRRIRLRRLKKMDKVALSETIKLLKET